MGNLDEIVKGLHPLEIRLLRALQALPDRPETEVAGAAGLDPAHFRRAVEWLLTKTLVTVARQGVDEVVRLTELGARYAESGGTPGDRIAALLAEKGTIPVSELANVTGLTNAEVFPAIGELKAQGIVAVDEGIAHAGEGAATAPVGQVSELLGRVAGPAGLPLSALSAVEQERVRMHVHKRFRAKGLFWIEEHVTRFFALTEQGAAVAGEVAKRGLSGDETSALTSQMLIDGSWREKSFRRYNIGLAPPRIAAARKHPYRQFLDHVKYKLLCMGFEEMTGPLVETEFWNMDALFMPQFHAARDIHDAYFVKAPSHARDLDPGHLSRVAEAHEHGGATGSRGWRYRFDRERARRLVLRSQGTAVSARTLGTGPKVPGKYFAMARCFRYDAADATHACDFLQIEGIVLDAESNFRTLLGLLKLFAMEVARSEEVVFTPGYFPFTEPSVEAHIKHPTLGWMELGGAGIFRPEVTAPFGVTVPVLAWGLGLDRMAMVALGLKDIRDLFSRDLDQLRAQRIATDMA